MFSQILTIRISSPKCPCPLFQPPASRSLRYAGISPPGTVVLKGKTAPADGGKPAQRVSPGLGYLSKNRKLEGLALTLSIADNITMTRYASCSRLGWLDLAKQRRQSDKLVTSVGVREQTATQPVQSLSGGNQQKVAIAAIFRSFSLAASAVAWGSFGTDWADAKMGMSKTTKTEGHRTIFINFVSGSNIVQSNKDLPLEKGCLETKS